MLTRVLILIYISFVFGLSARAAYQPAVSATIINSISSPVPVNIVSGTISTIASGTQVVSGAVSVTNFPATLATTTNQTLGISKLTSIDSTLATYLPSIDSNTSTFYALTDAQLRASPVPISGSVTAIASGTQIVSGSVNVGNFPASQAVTGTFWQATQPVSLASTIGVSAGQVTVLQGTSPWTVSGSISLNGTQPVNVLNSIGIASGTISASILNSLGIASGTLTGISSGISVSNTVAISAVSLPTHGVTQSGTWNAPSGTTTVSGTAQLTAGSAVIGSVGQSGVWSVGVSFTGTVAAATVSATTSGGTSLWTFGSNAARKSLEASNQTNANCWLKKGTGVTSATHTAYLLSGGGYYNIEQPIYTGAVTVICDAAITSGGFMFTEQ